MSYTSYAGGSLAQDNARALFAVRSKKAGELMRGGHSKTDAWSMVMGHPTKPRVKKEKKEKKEPEGGAILSGAVLGGRMHHKKMHHAKKPSVHHRVGLALREHM